MQVSGKETEDDPGMAGMAGMAPICTGNEGFLPHNVGCTIVVGFDKCAKLVFLEGQMGVARHRTRFEDHMPLPHECTLHVNLEKWMHKLAYKSWFPIQGLLYVTCDAHQG